MGNGMKKYTFTIIFSRGAGFGDSAPQISIFKLAQKLYGAIKIHHRFTQYKNIHPIICFVGF